MAKTSNNNKTTMFLNMVLILSLLLIITMAEGRSILGVAFTRPKPAPSCDFVVGVESGDTCFAITQALNMTTEFFNSINPNLNCDALFVGQWLCIDGTAS